MANTLNVSITAFPIQRYAHFNEFKRHVESFIGKASAAGSKALLLPEFSGMGLLWTDPRAESIDNLQVSQFYREVFNPLYKQYEDTLSSFAVRFDITILGATIWHEVDGKGVNTAFVFSPDGSVYHQDKIHLTRGERAINTCAGNKLLPFEIDGVKCGIVVCYDVQYPELTQHLAEQGVEVLFVPALTETRGSWREWHSAHARALENQMYVCVSPLLGPLDIPSDYRSVCRGQAFIACPIDNRFKIDDGTYAKLEMDEAGLLHSSLDLDLLRLSRQKAEVRQLMDRRPDFYKELSS